ncbi:helix-turn-helix domain-containing protein [Bosea sp. LjRoot90]|uniref:helix-turn-helix domain-containing protein n=1 Tax=Bosea sp. LjRoot90 TaxID=3342342 RepID=UPI003ED02DA6
MDIDFTPRTVRIRRALGLSQPEFAVRLGVSQSTVSRLELGQAETGPISRLLDLFEADIAPTPTPKAEPSRAACAAPRGNRTRLSTEAAR